MHATGLEPLHEGDVLRGGRADDAPGSLHFTHRTAHGASGQGDTTSLTDLASSTLQALKHSFPAVFTEPTFPIDRPEFF